MSTGVQIAVGKFVWHDHISAGRDNARSFYAEVFGWETEVFKPGEMDYPMIMVGGQGHGGFGPAEGGAPPHWLGHVLVEDLDETVSRARNAGGTIVAEPFDIPDVGRMAVIADPQGATLSAFAAAGEMPTGEGVFAWDELHTTDAEAAKRFYTDVFGWTTRDVDMGPITYTIFQRAGDVDAAGGYHMPPEVEAPPHWLVYIGTDDVDATVARAQELGASVQQEAMDIPGIGRFAVLQDPVGAFFGVFKPSAT